MRALTAYILRGPLQAILITVIFAALSPVIPIAAYLSAAVVALVTLQVGPRHTLPVMAGAWLALAVIATLALSVPPLAAGSLALTVGLTFWVPEWLLGGLLRATGSLGLAFQGAGALGILGVLAAFLFTGGDPAGAWRGLLETIRPDLEKAGLLTDPAQYDQLASFAPVIAGTMAAFAVLGMIVSLLIARALQAMLYHPGGLRAEFNALRYSRTTALVTLVILALGFLAQWPPALNLAIVLVLLYSFHGLAVAHGVVARAGVAGGWLGALYVVIALAALLPQTGILPHVLIVLALVGLADTWLKFRARVGGTGA